MCIRDRGNRIINQRKSVFIVCFVAYGRKTFSSFLYNVSLLLLLFVNLDFFLPIMIVLAVMSMIIFHFELGVFDCKKITVFNSYCLLILCYLYISYAGILIPLDSIKALSKRMVFHLTVVTVFGALPY